MPSIEHTDYKLMELAVKFFDLFSAFNVFNFSFITVLTIWILTIMLMRVHMEVMTLECTLVTLMDRTTPQTFQTVVNITWMSGHPEDQGYPSTVGVAIETYPEW